LKAPTVSEDPGNVQGGFILKGIESSLQKEMIYWCDESRFILKGIESLIR